MEIHSIEGAARAVTGKFVVKIVVLMVPLCPTAFVQGDTFSVQTPSLTPGDIFNSGTVPADCTKDEGEDVRELQFAAGVIDDVLSGNERSAAQYRQAQLKSWCAGDVNFQQQVNSFYKQLLSYNSSLRQRFDAGIQCYRAFITAGCRTRFTCYQSPLPPPPRPAPTCGGKTEGHQIPGDCGPGSFWSAAVGACPGGSGHCNWCTWYGAKGGRGLRKIIYDSKAASNYDPQAKRECATEHGQPPPRMLNVHEPCPLNDSGKSCFDALGRFICPDAGAQELRGGTSGALLQGGISNDMIEWAPWHSQVLASIVSRYPVGAPVRGTSSCRIEYTVHRDGSVSDVHVYFLSGDRNFTDIMGKLIKDLRAPPFPQGTHRQCVYKRASFNFTVARGSANRLQYPAAAPNPNDAKDVEYPEQEPPTIPCNTSQIHVVGR